jgi:hypothetical protein
MLNRRRSIQRLPRHATRIRVYDLGVRSCLPILLIFAALATTACTEQRPPDFDIPAPLTLRAGQPAVGPRLVQGPGGSVNLSWMERQKDSAILRYSKYLDGRWQAPVDVVIDPNMFVNWADLPGVQTTGADESFAYWMSYTSDDTYSYQLLTSQSSDQGKTWSTPISPHTDGTNTEQGFVSTFPSASGTGLMWLDGRNSPLRGITLRSVEIASDGIMSNETLLDDLVCDCCPTDIAVSSKGPIAVYRNRSEGEIRDIYAARQIEGQWQAGVAISDDGWKIDGCPVNGPAIAAKGNFVVVAWFTGANNEPTVKTSISTNAGKSFSTPVIISNNAPLGRVGVAIIDATTYVVSWLEPDQKETFVINIRSLTASGQMGRIRIAGRTSFASVLPQMVRVDNKLVLAWTDDINGKSKIASVGVSILGFYD